MDPGDPRRKEIGAAFGPAEGEPEALRRYGLGKGGFSFKPKKNLAPLQAADAGKVWIEDFDRKIPMPNNITVKQTTTHSGSRD